MSVLSKLASMQDRRDEEPNKELARELVRTKNTEGIQEIAENLWSKDKKIQSDCDGVMEEIGRNDPELIEEYVFDFLKLLSDKRNRRVWQSMICLSLIAEQKAQEIFENREYIIEAVEKGSVITQDNGIRTLAKVASVEDEYNQAIFPYLIEKLKTCRSKSVAQYAESIFCAVKLENQEEYIGVLNKRLGVLSSSQQRRVKKILRQLE
ncbi:MAG: hypothetical protein U9R25_01490 [Chloroflexota bacterium]|nr:hypothetical protein [Chloroflexota bacterium]